ncbi:hypothetical protein BUE76_06660 [Cnuella takakiae]|nr:hypothetical protein BUE76_06660 [Cnuella takakiae]
MSRRTALKQFLIVAGGVVLLPSCMQKGDTKAATSFKHLKLSSGEEQLLSELAETIIPATNTPGAKDLKVDQFALRMLDDCHSPEDQQAFEKGLQAFEQFSKKQQQKSFTELTPAQRTALLQQIESKKEVPEAVTQFYNKMKGLTIQGYMSSQHFLTKVQVYELVPGRYRGCVPLPQEARAKTV